LLIVHSKKLYSDRLSGCPLFPLFPEDVSIVPVAEMEVVSEGEDSLAGRRGRHVHGLEPLVVAERIGDSEMKIEEQESP